MACLLFMRLPSPKGLSSLCYTFCCSILTSYGVNESLGLHSLHLISFFGLGLVWVWAFLATPFHCFCHITTWLVLARPLLGLPCTFLLFNSRCPVFSPGLILIPSWVSLAHFIPLGFLGPFHSYIPIGFYYVFWASPT